MEKAVVTAGVQALRGSLTFLAVNEKKLVSEDSTGRAVPEAPLRTNLQDLDELCSHFGKQ